MIVDNKRVRWSYNGLFSTCTIETLTPVGVEPEILSKHTIKRYVRDRENKEKARKNTLTGAALGLPKAERYGVWEAYRTARKQNRWPQECKPRSH